MKIKNIYLLDRLLTNYCRLQVDEHCTGYMFAGAGFAEEGVEGIVSTSDGFVSRHLAIRLDAMLKAVELPASVTDLDSSLANVYGDALTLEK